MNLLGVDNSITSPGLVILNTDDDYNVVSKYFITLSDVKKYEMKDEFGEIIHYKKADFDDQYNKIVELHHIIEKRLGDLSSFDYVAFEDYAFGGMGQTFSIAESTSLLKYKFYNAGVPIRLYSVPSIKLYASGKGNADKIKMEDMYEAHSGKINLNFLPACFEKKSPKDNIIDAFFIANMLKDELAIRDNKMSEISAINKQIFIERSKKSKTIPYSHQPFLKNK